MSEFFCIFAPKIKRGPQRTLTAKVHMTDVSGIVLSRRASEKSR